MRKALVPGAYGVELFGAGLGRKVWDGVELLRGENGVVEAGGRWGGAALIDAALDPELAGPTILPIGKNGDAVACAHDVREMMFEFAEGQVLVDDLRHIEARLKGEG